MRRLRTAIPMKDERSLRVPKGVMLRLRRKRTGELERLQERRRMAIIQEFREFAIKGNMVDLAVAVIIGAAFSKIIDSLVRDIIMPVIGLFLGGVDFSNLFITLGSGNYASLAEAENAGAAVLRYGVFLQTLVDFLIIAWVIFLVIKAINRMKREQPAPAPAAPPEEVVLLREIRDAVRRP
jgi:large conductance mechanosensitive channel